MSVIKIENTPAKAEIKNLVIGHSDQGLLEDQRSGGLPDPQIRLAHF